MKTRRDFIKTSALLGGLVACPQLSFANETTPSEKWFSISLAQWSLHRAFKAGHLYPENFAPVARQDFGIEAVEYVSQFYEGKTSSSYWREMRKIADDEGVKSLLIMVDGEGRLGDPVAKKRLKAAKNHKKWINAAAKLGCHSIRVNAASEGGYDEQRKLVIDGLRQLTELAEPASINVIVENHGGLSSNGAWLNSVIKGVDHSNCGTLPDFGNFTIDEDKGEYYDRYKGLEELMPYAKGVSAKSYDFDRKGTETSIDYSRALDIVKKSGYDGYIGIEYEGMGMREKAGILATKELLQSLGGR